MHSDRADASSVTSIRLGVSKVHGLGVVATRDIAAGEVIEECPVLVLPPDDRVLLDQTSLYGYYFEWVNGGAALALGLGSMYNHAAYANARWEKDYIRNRVVYSALRDIPAGTEICACYGDADELWFVPIPVEEE